MDSFEIFTIQFNLKKKMDSTDVDNFLAEGLDILSLEETTKEKRGTLKTNNEGRKY